MDIRQSLHEDLKLPKSPYTGERTYSALFLIPAFGLNMDSDIYDYFVNAYIDDGEISHVFARPLFLLLATPEITPRFLKVHYELLMNKNFVYTYCVGTYDKNLLYMYVFECPDIFREDYEKFLKGQYSKFSEKYKGFFVKSVPNIHGEYEESPLFGAIYKTNVFKRKVEKIIDERLDKNQEYFGIPERKIEVFRYPEEKKELKNNKHVPEN